MSNGEVQSRLSESSLLTSAVRNSIFCGSLFLRIVGGTYVGVALIGLIVAYVGAVSVLLQVQPDHRVLGLSGARPYAHPILLALAALLSVNLLVASIHRIKFDLPRLGAWCSHAGVLVLLAGTMWYVLDAQKGDALSTLVQTPPGHPGPPAYSWSPIDSFCLEDTFALHIETGSYKNQASLGDLCDCADKYLKTQIDAGGDLKIQVFRYIEKAVLRERWANDGPQPLGAVELQVSDRENSGRAVICPAMERYLGIQGHGYILMYHPDATEALAKNVLANPMPPGMAGASLLMIVHGKDIPARVLVLRSDGKRSSLDLKVDEPLEIELPDQTVAIGVSRFFDRARMSYEGRPALASEGELAVGAVEVELSRGDWRHRTFLPFSRYPSQADWLSIPLPGEGTARLAFSRRSLPLGRTLQIVSTEYQTNPGTAMPRDYRCEVDLEKSGRGTISLNHPLDVGPYQVSQGSWAPSGPEVRQIVLGVASRPGVWMVYLGMILISAGFPWAFYVKPILLRKRGRG
jgi:hypothetical protein